MNHARLGQMGPYLPRPPQKREPDAVRGNPHKVFSDFEGFEIMSRQSWVGCSMVLERDGKVLRPFEWWAIPSDVLARDRHAYYRVRPPEAPWVHTSYARGWPRCSICRAPTRPGTECQIVSQSTKLGRLRHCDYPNYAALAHAVEPRFRKPEKPVQVGRVAP